MNERARKTSEKRTVNTGHIVKADFKEGCVYVLDAMTKKECSWKRIPRLLYFLSPSSCHCLPLAEQGTDPVKGTINASCIHSNFLVCGINGLL